MTDNFSLIHNILFQKKKVDLYPGDECSPWVINKGISFHSPSMNQLINHTANIYSSILDDQEYIEFVNLIVPKTSYRRVSWMKSDKKTPKKNITNYAKYLEISSNELADILDFLPQFIEEDDNKDESLKTYKTKSK
jgi:hypothetical protein